MGSHYSVGQAAVSVTLHVDHTETYTTAIVDDGECVGIGTSKRNPSDPFDQVLGQRIAAGRAFADLATAQLAAALAEEEVTADE